MSKGDNQGTVERGLRLLADKAPVMVWVAGPDKACTWFNRPWLDFTGRALHEEIGTGWTDNVHHEDLTRCRDIFSAKFDAREGFSREFRLRHRAGGYRWILDHGLPIHAEDGTFAGYVGSCVDITRQKELEGQLMLDAQRKDLFIATLAHELRNPLAPLTLSVDMMQSSSLGPEARAPLLATMRRQLRHMERLVDDLADVTRLNQDTLTLRRGDCHMAEVIDDAVAMTRDAVSGGNHRLDVAISTDAVFDADRVRVTQIIANLIHNATKYTSPGGHLRVNARQTGIGVEITVADNGAGIAPEVLATIFEPFSRLEGPGANRRAGLGIGLYLARRLAELHGGHLAASSAGEGLGASFTLSLPSRAPATPSARGNEEPREAAPFRQHVLLVEDHADVAAITAAACRMLGAEVTIASTGCMAVELAQRIKPTLALLDIGLPDIDGHEVARRLRAIPALEDTTLIGLSGWSEPATRKLAIESGMAMLLAKPIDLVTLEKLLQAKPLPASLIS